MQEYAEPLQRLIEQFRRLPSVGSKSAARMAFAVLAFSEEEAAAFADAVMEAVAFAVIIRRAISARSAVIPSAIARLFVLLRMRAISSPLSARENIEGYIMFSAALCRLSTVSHRIRFALLP